jgi:predicted lactoylglutathione lyase
MARHRTPLANVITLGVTDFDVERTFYRRMGWPQALDSDDFAVFELRGALLALFPVEKLAADARARSGTKDGVCFSVIISVDEPNQVDALIDVARGAGATISKDPTDAEFFEGRDAYFADPEGNFWEVAWAPADNPVAVAARRAAGVSDEGTLD